MKYYLFLFFLFLVVACETIDGVTASQYEYTFHVDEEGASPKVGDQVIFWEEVFHNDQLIYSSTDYGKKEIILPKEEILTKPLPPNYEILFKMSPGDSVSIIQKLQGLKNLPKGYKTADVLKYSVKLLKIIPKEELQLSKKKDRTEANYPFEFFTQTGNIIAQPGDRVKYMEFRFVNDSLTFSTPLEKPLQALLPARKMVPNPPPGNYEALLLSGIGDSCHLSQLLENLADLPSNLTRKDTINYRIKIIDIFTPGEYVILKKELGAKAEMEKQDAIARKAEIEKMTQTNIEKYKNGELDDALNYTRSGLKYFIHQQGEGKMPNPTEEVEVRYAGFLMDGTPFESLFETGETYTFPLGTGRVIKGWDEGISKLPVGAKATLFVPSKLAYGMRGHRGKNIPRRADLVFYIEIVDAE